MFEVPGDAQGQIKFGDFYPVVVETGAKAKAGKVNAQFLKTTGATDVTYTWTGTYWLSSKTKKNASDELLPAGKALWLINNTGSAIALKSSGEVNQKDILFPLQLSGGAVAGNAFPVDTTFASIIPKVHSTGAAAKAGKVNLQYLKTTGATDVTYTWTGTYWLSSKTKKNASTEVVPAGKGFWVINNTGDAADIYIAAPEFDVK